MHGSHHNHGAQQSAPMMCLVTGHETCCHNLGLRHWIQHVSWVIDLHQMLLSVELRSQGWRDLMLTLDERVWRVRIRDGERELVTGSCVFLGYASEAEVLWCNDEKT